MITRFKIFETIYRPLQKNDYVIFKDGTTGSVLSSFGSFEINTNFVYKVEYIVSPGREIGVTIDDDSCRVNIQDVLYYSENEEELEQFLKSKKFNV